MHKTCTWKGGRGAVCKELFGFCSLHHTDSYSNMTLPALPALHSVTEEKSFFCYILDRQPGHGNRVDLSLSIHTHTES